MHIVNHLFLYSQVRQSDTKGNSVMIIVIEHLLKLYHFGNKMLIKVSVKKMKANKFIIKEIAKIILKLYAILKRDDMRENEEPKVRIHYKNGCSLKNNIIIDVLNVEIKNHSQKTISYQFLKMAQIISIIFNRFVVTVIAKSGQINIHQHPELREQDNG